MLFFTALILKDELINRFLICFVCVCIRQVHLNVFHCAVYKVAVPRFTRKGTVSHVACILTRHLLILQTAVEVNAYQAVRDIHVILIVPVCDAVVDEIRHHCGIDLHTVIALDVHGILSAEKYSRLAEDAEHKYRHYYYRNNYASGGDDSVARFLALLCLLHCKKFFFLRQLIFKSLPAVSVSFSHYRFHL